ncbi:MAG: LytTR family transcriptional regulator [Clostridiales bacterium]|nr:LytTR family transcriptional regulator [Clostridiales bacterium]
MKRIVVRKRGELHALRPEEVIFMEKELRKITAHTVHGKIEFYGTFSKLIPSLDNRFMCCHRSFIINMDKINVMAGNSIFLVDGPRILFGRATYERAKKVFSAYLNMV